MTTFKRSSKLRFAAWMATAATSLLAVEVAAHEISERGAPTRVASGSYAEPAASEERYAPSRPTAVVHFVKHARFAASSGETLKVHLTIMTSEDVNTLDVVARPESGLVLLNTSQESEGPFKAGSEVTATFEVTALAEGRHYLNVVATAEEATGRHVSSYSLPVEVGNLDAAVKSKEHSTVVEDDQGNRLMLMPSVTPGNSVKDR